MLPASGEDRPLTARRLGNEEPMTTITATLIDAEHVEAEGQTRKYKRPVFDLARALIREGHDPETILVTRWGWPSRIRARARS